jgi:predicted acyl esterase
VPFRARPIQQIGSSPGQTWQQWLTDDQREASGRTDVVTFISPVLTKPLRISGQPMVHLMASTSGTDSDWVVKLIDVYPDEVYAQPEMGGYQLAVGMDILRGRYREGFVTPKPIKANKPLAYEFKLPPSNHVFLPGHRLMVQVQSVGSLCGRPQSRPSCPTSSLPSLRHFASHAACNPGQGRFLHRAARGGEHG